MRYLALIFSLFALISAAVFGYQGTKDTDFGWHYRCGKILIEEGDPCLRNSFSYYLPDYSSYNPSFIYDSILAIIYDSFGFNGLAIFNSLIIVAAIGFLISITKLPYSVKAVGLFLLFYLSGPTIKLGLRSQVLTVLLTLLLLYLIKKSRRNPKVLLIIPFIFLFWVNTHIGFISGVIIISALLFEAFLKYVVYEGVENAKNLKRIGSVFIASLIFTLINPFGFLVYVELINHSLTPLGKMIYEWLAPPSLFIMVIIISFLALIYLQFKNKVYTVFGLILVLIFSFLATQAVRNIALHIIIYLFALSEFFSSKVTLDRAESKRSHILDWFIGMAIIGLIIVISAKELGASFKFNSDLQSYCRNGQTMMPCSVVTAFPDLSGNIFSMYEWGGYLIWKYPNAKVFSDGRMPAWKNESNQSPYEVNLALVQGAEGWDKYLKLHKTDYILIGESAGLALRLKESGKELGWEELIRTEGAVLYKLKSDKNPNKPR